MTIDEMVARLNDQGYKVVKGEYVNVDLMGRRPLGENQTWVFRWPASTRRPRALVVEEEL